MIRSSANSNAFLPPNLHDNNSSRPRLILFYFFHFFPPPCPPPPFSPSGRCRRHNSLSERRRLTHKSVAGNLAALTERAKHSQAARKFSGSPTTPRSYLIGDLLFLAAALNFFFFSLSPFSLPSSYGEMCPIRLRRGRQRRETSDC